MNSPKNNKGKVYIRVTSNKNKSVERCLSQYTNQLAPGLLHNCTPWPGPLRILLIAITLLGCIVSLPSSWLRAKNVAGLLPLFNLFHLQSNLCIIFITEIDKVGVLFS